MTAADPPQRRGAALLASAKRAAGRGMAGARAAAWAGRYPERLATLRAQPADRQGRKLAQAYRDANPWWMATLLQGLPPKERHILGAALLQDAGVVLRIERPPHVWYASPSSDEIVTEIIEAGAYSIAESRAVIEFATRHRPTATHPMVVDVGANIGTTTVPFAEAGYRVIAIEPVPLTAQLLRMNLSSNSVDDACTVVEVAVVRSGDRTVEMLVTPRLGGNEVATTAEDGTADAPRITVPAGGLGSVLGEQSVEPSAIALVWSDTEGSELAVVETGEELWAEGVPLWLELNPHSLERHSGSAPLLGRLAGLFVGFVPLDVLVDDPVSPPVTPIEGLPELFRSIGDGPYDFTNALFLPRGLDG